MVAVPQLSYWSFPDLMLGIFMNYFDNPIHNDIKDRPRVALMYYH